MAGLTPQAMLTAWEAGAGRAPVDRALALLWAAGHEGALADWPVVTRDAALLALRAATFGPDVEMVADCPECGAELELSLPVAGLMTAPVDVPTSEVEGVILRAVTSRDLAALAGVSEADLGAALLARLLGEVPPGDTSGALQEQLEAREAAHEIALALTCPDCAASWRDAVDVVALVWAEVEAAAARMMAEVADLARAYGWTEAECLSLPATRRAQYLALARSQ